MKLSEVKPGQIIERSDEALSAADMRESLQRFMRPIPGYHQAPERAATLSTREMVEMAVAQAMRRKNPNPMVLGSFRGTFPGDNGWTITPDSRLAGERLIVFGVTPIQGSSRAMVSGQFLGSKPDWLLGNTVHIPGHQMAEWSYAGYSWMDGIIRFLHARQIDQVKAQWQLIFEQMKEKSMELSLRQRD